MIKWDIVGNDDLGLWDHVLYFWVSWCFCDAVAPEDQMRLCGKCWFEGNETIFFISESPDAFVTLLHLMIKWEIVGNDDLGLWDHVLYFWVSWCFCDAVAPYVHMRLCGKCWFEGNESLFLIPESPDAFVTLLHLMIKWGIMGNVNLRAMRPYSLFLSLLMLLWRCCTRRSNETLWEMMIWGYETMFYISESPDAFVTLLHLMIKWNIMGNDDLGLWDHVLYFWVSWCFCDAVAPDDQMEHYGKWWFGVMRPCSLFLSLLMLLWRCCPWRSNETLWEMLIWGQWDHILYFWVSWCFCDAVAPEDQMRLCGKWWFGVMRPCSIFLSLLMLLWRCCTWWSNGTLWEMMIWGYETMFFISESPDAFVTLLHLMIKWNIMGNDDLGLWDHVLYFWVSWCFCDAVAPEDQMRLCGKCWFEGNETIFFISESPDAFVTLLPLMFKWDIVGNVDLGLRDHVLYFWVSWCFCDTVAPDDQMRLCGKWWFGVMRPCSIFLSLLMLLWRCCTWWSNGTLWEMMIWGYETMGMVTPPQFFFFKVICFIESDKS